MYIGSRSPFNKSCRVNCYQCLMFFSIDKLLVHSYILKYQTYFNVNFGMKNAQDYTKLECVWL